MEFCKGVERSLCPLTITRHPQILSWTTVRNLSGQETAVVDGRWQANSVHGEGRQPPNKSMNNIKKCLDCFATAAIIGIVIERHSIWALRLKGTQLLAGLHETSHIARCSRRFHLSTKIHCLYFEGVCPQSHTPLWWFICSMVLFSFPWPVDRPVLNAKVYMLLRRFSYRKAHSSQ